MGLPKPGLRAKMFLGGALLLVPLGITLLFLTQYSLGQIQTAEKELLGQKASAPLVNILLAWTKAGPTAGPSAELVRNLEEFRGTMKTAELLLGPPWSEGEDPSEALGAGAAGDPLVFAETSRQLLTEIRRLADQSGLVLDPDLDSYYLVLAIYQGLPDVMDEITLLETIFETNPGDLSSRARINLAISAESLARQTTLIQDWTELSVRAAAQGRGTVPGYEDQARAASETLAIAGAALRRPALAMAEGAEAWNPEVLSPRLAALVAGLNPFHEVGSPALAHMLGHRIDALTFQLTAAWVAALAGLALSTGVFLALGNSVRRRSAGLVAALGALADGDLTRVPLDASTQSNDELGDLGRSVRRLQDDLTSAVRSIAEVNNELAALGSGLAATAEESASAIEQMSAAAGQVAQVAQGQSSQTARASGDVDDMVDRVSEANTLTQGIATQFFLFSQAMEANRRRIQATASEARVTGQLAVDLDEAGQEGERTLEALRTAIGGVARQTQEIQEIVQFILDIADRTNLLSMNAGIEAAHAGNQGRGFKVVADEIRKLAETSGTQAQNIRTLVDGIAAAARTTLERSEATGSAFHRVRTDIASVRTASQAIADQIALQEAEDGKLTEGLEEFTRFYSDLSGSMDIQVIQSEAIRQVMKLLADSSGQISQSTAEQRVGMAQASGAVIQMRDTSMEVARILDQLSGLVSRFQVEAGQPKT